MFIKLSCVVAQKKPVCFLLEPSGSTDGSHFCSAESEDETAVATADKREREKEKKDSLISLTNSGGGEKKRQLRRVETVGGFGGLGQRGLRRGLGLAGCSSSFSSSTASASIEPSATQVRASTLCVEAIKEVSAGGLCKDSWTGTPATQTCPANPLSILPSA